MANQYGDVALSNAGQPVTMGPVGFWLDANGDVSATDPQGKPQQTPGQRDNPQATIYYDAAKDLNYNLVNGKKLYQSPVTYAGKAQGTGHGMVSPSGSLLKSGGTWNPETGEFDQGANWGNILSMVVAGALTAGVADAIMGAGAGTTAAAASSGTVPSTGATAGALGADAAATAPLASTAVPAAGALATGAAPSGAVAAATSAAGGATGAVANAGSSGTPSWLAPLIGSGISAAGGLIGAGIQSSAISDAAKINAESVANALAFEKQKYGDVVGRLQPYMNSGTSANSREAALLGLPAPAPQTAAPQQTAPAPSPASSTPAGTVLMMAPDGSQKRVNQADVARATQAGAKVVNG